MEVDDWVTEVDLSHIHAALRQNLDHDNDNDDGDDSDHDDPLEGISDIHIYVVT